MTNFSTYSSNTRWPQYLPYPKPLGKSVGPVPNRTAIDWPQAQFAPSYLPQGSASVQPFSYNPNYRTLYGIGGSVYDTQTPRNEYGCSTCSGEANDNPEHLDEFDYVTLLKGVVLGIGLAYVVRRWG